MSKRYGLARPDEISGLSGREVLQAIVEGRLPQAPISQSNSFWIAEVGEGRAVFEGQTCAELCNPSGSVHGGWALLLIDSATACAAHSLLGPGLGTTSIETKANFTKPILVNTGLVRCEGRVIAPGRQIIVAEAQIKDSRGRTLAHGTSTIMVTGPRESLS